MFSIIVMVFFAGLAVSGAYDAVNGSGTQTFAMSFIKIFVGLIGLSAYVYSEVRGQ